MNYSRLPPAQPPADAAWRHALRALRGMLPARHAGCVQLALRLQTDIKWSIYVSESNINATAIDNSSHESRRAPDRSWFNVCLMSVSHFMSDYYTAFLPVLLPVMAMRYDISYTQSAAIYMAFMVTMNFVQAPIGIAADRRHLNYLLPLSILTGALFASGTTLSPNLVGLLMIILLCGLCSSAFHPLSAAVVSRIVPEDRKGLGTSIYIAGGNIGFAIAPLCVAAWFDWFGESSLIFMSIPAIITVILIYRQRLHNAVTARPELSRELSLKSLLHCRPFIILITSIALRSCTYCSFVVFLTLLMTGEGYSTITSASCLMVMLLGCVAGGLAGGSLTDIIGPKAVTLGSYFVALIASAVFLTRIDTSLISFAALFLCGAGAYGSTPGGIVWSQRLLSGSAAFAASMMLGFTFGAGYIVSVLTGYLGDMIGLDKALLYVNAVTMTGAIILLLPLSAPAPEAAGKEGSAA